jgi:hypothetical protein
MPSPQTPAIDLLGTDAAPVTIATSYAAAATSAAVDVFGHDTAAFYVWIDGVASATQLDITIEVSPTGSATATEWVALKTEAVTSGAATQSSYELQVDVTGMSADPTLAIFVPAPVRGAAYMRCKLKADSACTGHVSYTLSGS